MTIAWYGHLKFSEWKWFSKLGLLSIVLISWGIALFEYAFQVPANKIGFKENGGPFTLIQLKSNSGSNNLAWFCNFYARCIQNRNIPDKSHNCIYIFDISSLFYV